MSLTLSIDIGTGSVKAGLLESDSGRWLGSASRRIATRHDASRAEQDARDYWSSTLDAVSEIRAAVGEGFRELRAISVTGQMRSLVPVRHNGEPAGPVLTLYDRRAAEEYDEFLSHFGLKAIYDITGQRFDVASTPSKLRWLRRHEPEILRSAWKVLAPKDYVRLRLTGQADTDPIDASGWLLYDLQNRSWNACLVEFSGITHQQLPAIRAACSIAGTLLPEIADEWGVRRDVAVAVGGGDDIAATGCGVTQAGDVYEHIGSTGSVFALTDRPVLDPEMILECYPTETTGSFWVGGSCNSAGTAIDHALRLSSFCQGGIIDWKSVAAALEQWDKGTPQDRPMFLPYVAGERCPIWNASIRAGWTNVQLTHSPVDWAIAAHEGPAYVLGWILDELRRLLPSVGTIYTAGKAAESQSFGRLRASIYDRAIQRIDQPDATLLGAAMIALVAIGEAGNVRDLALRWGKVAWTAAPEPGRVTAYTQCRRVFQQRTRELMTVAERGR